jgi:protection of telomeres protein 1
LRENVQNLDALREKMFTLWGNLEEHKAKQHARHLAMAARTPGDKPPLDDSDDEGNLTTDQVSNKPFMCCIQQYGVRLPEEDPRKAVAGAGRTWQRTFAMFGTKISA